MLTDGTGDVPHALCVWGLMENIIIMTTINFRMENVLQLEAARQDYKTKDLKKNGLQSYNNGDDYYYSYIYIYRLTVRRCSLLMDSCSSQSAQ